MKAIGKIVLNKDMIGWVDKVNRIILTVKNPEAEIYQGFNMFFIEKAVEEGRITFVKYDE